METTNYFRDDVMVKRPISSYEFWQKGVELVKAHETREPLPALLLAAQCRTVPTRCTGWRC